MKQKIYLAGPEVFLPETLAYFQKTKDLCLSYGFDAVCPFDSEPIFETGMGKADKIFQNNIQLIDSSDILLAKCNVFRGALVDDGTAFEIGYAYAQKKKIFGFLTKRLPLVENVVRTIETSEHHSGYPIDAQGYLVNEDFGNAINLMMEMAIQHTGGLLVEGSVEDVLKIIKSHLF